MDTARAVKLFHVIGVCPSPLHLGGEVSELHSSFGLLARVFVVMLRSISSPLRLITEPMLKRDLTE